MRCSSCGINFVGRSMMYNLSYRLTAGPSVVNDDFGDVLGVFYGLTGEGYSYRELEDQAKLIKKRTVESKGRSQGRNLWCTTSDD